MPSATTAARYRRMVTWEWTPAPNQVAEPINDRMPVIIAPEEKEDWLTSSLRAPLEAMMHTNERWLGLWQMSDRVVRNVLHRDKQNAYSPPEIILLSQVWYKTPGQSTQRDVLLAVNNPMRKITSCVRGINSYVLIPSIFTLNQENENE